MSYTAGITPRLRKILQSSDLSTISAKAVRKELVRQGEDEETVKANRKDIDAKISEIYDELTGAASGASSSSEEIALTSSRPSASQHVAMPPSSFPEPLADRKPKVKAEVKDEKPKPSASSSRANGNANGAGALDRYGAETDEQMARRLQEEFDAMENGRPSRRSAAPKPKKKKSAAGAAKKRKSAATVDSDDDGEKPAKKRKAGGGSGAFNKDLVLSDALAEFTGEARLSRPQTVKRIWDYVKANDLQDTGDKRFIICDYRLKSVFHVDRLHMFTMNKLLSQHFMDPDDIIPYKEESSADVKPVHRPPPVALPISTGNSVTVNLPRPNVTAVYEESDDDDDDDEDDYEEEE